MKNFLFKSIICFFLVISLSSCSEFKSEVRPLKGNLSTFTVQEESTERVLIGVKDTITNNVIVPPNKYIKFDVDDQFIYAYDKYHITVFSTSGQKIFQEFASKVEKNEAGHIIATINGKKQLYFPKTQRIINLKNYHIAGYYLLAEDNFEWKVYLLNGSQAFYFPQEAVLLHSTDDEIDYYMVAIPDTTKHGKKIYKLYSLEGRRKIIYTDYTWKKLENSFKKTQRVGSLTIAEVNI
jgi:hypothetical protein